MTDFIIIILTFSFSAFFLYTLYILYKRNSLITSVPIFLIGSVLYFYMIPFELWIKNSNGYYVNDIFLDVDNYLVIEIFILAFLSIIFFISGFYLGGGNKLSSRCSIEFNLTKPTRRSEIGFYLIIIIFLFFYIDDILIATIGYLFVAENSYEKPVFVIFQYVLLICFSYFGSIYLLLKNSTKGFSYISIPILYGILTTDKNSILLGLIAIFISLNVKKILPILLSVISLIILLPLIRSFSIWRGGESFERALIISLENFTFTKLDPAGPFASIVYYFSENEIGYGYTFIENITLLIPKAILNYREIDLAEKFAQLFISNWSAGRGLGFSPLAEAFYNFSYAAPLYFLIIGLYWTIFWVLVKKIWVKILPPNNFYIFYMVVGFYFIILFFRGTSLLFVKIMPLHVALSLLILFFLNLLKFRLRIK